MNKPALIITGICLIFLLLVPVMARVSAGREEPATRQAEPATSSGAITPEPLIVSMNPPNGASKVNPGLTQLTVSFNQPMGGGFSWTGGGPNFPEGTGTPYWSPDERTCVMGVRLKPNWSYRLGLNSPSHQNFRSQSGVPLKPVVWQFQTQ